MLEPVAAAAAAAVSEGGVRERKQGQVAEVAIAEVVGVRAGCCYCCYFF